MVVENLSVPESGKKNSKDIKVESLIVEKGEKIGICSLDETEAEVLLKVFAGINGYEGSIKVFGKELNENRKKIAEKMGIYFDKTVYPNIKLRKFMDMTGSFYRGVTVPRIEDVMKKYRLIKLGDAKLKYLDRFFVKKAGLAAASLNYPELYILSGIFSDLDDESKTIIKEVVREEIDSKTAIVSSSSREDLENLCSRIYEINDGELNVVYWN